MDPVSRAQNSNSSARKVIGRPFPKGTSGNPGGRPKKKPITEIFEELLADPKVREAIKKRIYKTITTKGMAGVLLLKEGTERLEGKIADQLEVSDYRQMSDEELEAKLKALQDARSGS